MHGKHLPDGTPAPLVTSKSSDAYLERIARRRKLAFVYLGTIGFFVYVPMATGTTHVSPSWVLGFRTAPEVPYLHFVFAWILATVYTVLLTAVGIAADSRMR